MHREANASVPSVSDALYSAELIAVIRHLQKRFRVPQGAQGGSRMLKGTHVRALPPSDSFKRAVNFDARNGSTPVTSRGDRHQLWPTKEH